ncbi:MAG: DUF192 domain-containing protein [Candidatus Norongarragalinales archaeon]
MERWVSIRTRKRSGRKSFKAKLAESLFSKAKGIMFAAPTFTPLLFDFGREARLSNAIHSFFCPAFDAVFLDSQKRVTQTTVVRPWRFLVPATPSRFLIELPLGEAKRLGLKKGLKLAW